MAKICLIQPPNPLLASPEMYFPLSLLYLGAVLEKHGHQVSIFDLRRLRATLDIMDFPKADFYGITATTGEIKYAKTIAKLLKKKYPGCVTIIGGAHPSLLSKDCVDDFDYVVVGEGERAILTIVETNPSPGIIGGSAIYHLDTLPFPARHLLPEPAVFTNNLFPGEKYGTGPKATSVISSRGCPYNCAFCANIPQPVRFRKPEPFVSEIKYLQDHYDCHHFRFLDDTFTLDKGRVLEICERLEPLKVHYKCHTRSNLLDEETCRAFKKSGCEEMGLGVETADNDVLELINKRETVEDHKNAVRLIKEAGMRAKVYWMTSLPGETWKTIKLNKQFMRETKPDKFTVSVFMPYPGCDIAKHPLKYGVEILSVDWSRYWNFPESSVIESDVAFNEELNEHYRHFYGFCKSEAWKK